MLSSYKQIGQNHIHFKEIDSTNVYATNLLAKTNPIDGTVISADFQTAGKGQYDRKWLSNPGENIIMSIILYPNFLIAQHQIFLNMAIALGIHDFLNNFNNDFSIKWPNDIYHQNSKIAGILIQNQLQGETIKNAVIGIGLNLNQKIFDHDITNPTSLSLITGFSYNINSEIKKLCESVESRYNALQSIENLEKLKSEFESKLYGLHKWVNFKYNSESSYLPAKIIGVNNTGKLLVQSEDSLVVELTHGEVALIYP
jgi:BirA family transcriptional regulator, biotin operon repressor / biotin---[acetyl-CoA-carboxylase] ligase